MSSFKKRIRSATTVAVLAATVGLAACGDDDDDDGAAASTSEAEGTSPAEATSPAETTAGAATTSASEPATDTEAGSDTSGPSETDAPAAPSGDPVRIGIAVGQTGFNAPAQSPAVDVVEAWAEWVNDNGGVDGRPVELVVKDTQATANTAQAAVKELVEAEGAVAVMLMDAAGAGGVGDYPVQQNVAVVGVGTFNGGQWGALPNYFSVATDATAGSRSYATAGKLVGASSVGIIVCAEVAVCLDAGSRVEAQAEIEGIDYAGVVKAAAADPNYTAQCLTLMQNGADFIALGLSSEVWLRAGPDCRTQGYDQPFGIVTGSFILQYLDQIEDGIFAGGINTFPWWVDDPAVQEYRDTMAEYAPDLDYHGTFSSGAWSSMQLIKFALENHDGVEATKEDVLAAMHTIKDETLGGLLPHAVTFTAGEPSEQFPCVWMARYEAGSGEPEIMEYPTEDSNGAEGDLRSSCLDPLP